MPVDMFPRNADKHRALRRLPRILHNIGNKRIGVAKHLRAGNQRRQLSDLFSHAVSSQKICNYKIVLYGLLRFFTANIFFIL